jgi:hypothetical protein
MTIERDKSRQSDEERERDYVKGGKGRRDEVGGSGIYPASSPDAPHDAEIRSPGDFAVHKGGRRRAPDDEQDVDSDQSSGSE